MEKDLKETGIERRVDIKVRKNLTSPEDIQTRIIGKLEWYFDEQPVLKNLLKTGDFYYVIMNETVPGEDGKGACLKGKAYLTDKRQMVDVSLLMAFGWFAGFKFQKMKIDSSFDNAMATLFEV